VAGNGPCCLRTDRTCQDKSGIHVLGRKVIVEGVTAGGAGRREQPKRVTLRRGSCPPPQPPVPERPPEPAPKPRAGYINTKGAAEYMGFKPNTLRVWRMKGTGPKGWLRVCGRVYYPAEALDQFFRDAASNSKVPHRN
jgi:hypothetical protein